MNSWPGRRLRTRNFNQAPRLTPNCPIQIGTSDDGARTTSSRATIYTSWFRRCQRLVLGSANWRHHFFQSIVPVWSPAVYRLQRLTHHPEVNPVYHAKATDADCLRFNWRIPSPERPSNKAAAQPNACNVARGRLVSLYVYCAGEHY